MIEIVCYPIEDDGSIVHVEGQTVLATEPGDVVVIDEGVVLEGDVNLNGANTVLFGFDPVDTVLDGSVQLGGSDTIARGLRITGDLTLSGGNAAAIFVEVVGDVFVTGNGALLASSVVHGTVHYSGSNFDLVGNALQGGLDASAGLGSCGDNVLFDDLDEDFFLDRDVEVTAPFVCP